MKAYIFLLVLSFEILFINIFCCEIIFFSVLLCILSDINLHGQLFLMS